MNASVTFSTSPWLLLLALPLFAVIFSLVFVRKKKGARITANLVLSTTFQCLAVLCFVFAISGIQIEYDEVNVPKEAIVLVDTSFSASSQRDGMDEFVSDILTQSVGRCKVGIVLFGHTQKVALNVAELKTVEEAEQAYKRYLTVMSQTPKDDATDIAAALRFVWNAQSANNLISDPARAKVVILSDGLQTDGDAIGAMKQLTRNGVQLETSFYADNYFSDTSIFEVTYPSNNIYVGDKFDISVMAKSSHSCQGQLLIVDKDEQGQQTEKNVSVSLHSGTQKILVPFSFENEGFHQLDFQLIVQDEQEEKNNLFCSYFELAKKNKILVLEAFDGEAQKLNSLLEDVAEKGHIDIEVKEIETVQGFMAKDFAKYNEVVLYNIAAEDMQKELQLELESFVNQFGGGLFTIGGFEKDEQGDIKMMPKENNPDEEVPVLHSYKESDLNRSVLADLLPVKVEAYKPAVAVVFVFDISSSMTGQYSGAAICTAAEDARYIMDNVLEPKDYVGIVTLQEDYAQTSPLSPMTKKDELENTITELEDFYDFDACTKYAPAFEQAALILANAPLEVARKHIILFSDGMPSDSLDVYGKIISEANQKQGITLTVVTYYKRITYYDGVPYYFNHEYDFPGYEIKIDRMKTLAGYGGGSFVLLSRDKTVHGVEPYFKKDLKLEQLDDLCYQEYSPKKGEETGILENITSLDLEKLRLKGYFPSKVKVSDGVHIPLIANGAPLYAEWAYGNGRVGSIMIDLEGKWSADLINTATGKTIVENIVTSLLMTISEPQNTSFEVSLSEENMHTQVNIFNLSDEEEADTKMVALVQSPNEAKPAKFDLGKISSGGRFVFENLQSGVYTISVMKVRLDYDFLGSNVKSLTDIPEDVLLETVTLHRVFSYSKEYDGREDPYTTGRDLLSALSSREATGGAEYSKFIYDAKQLFVPYGNTHHTSDLRQILLVCAMVIYLLGIVLRLFKIKFFTRNKKKA